MSVAAVHNLIARTTLLLFAGTWVLDPTYFGYAGYEGVIRWGVLVLLAVVGLAFGDVRFYSTKIFCWLAALILALAASVTLNGANVEQLVEVTRIAPIAFVGSLVLGLRTRNRMDAAIGDLTLLFGLAVTGSLILALLGLRSTPEGRLFGITPHPNVLGLVAVTFVLILAVGRKDTRRAAHLLGIAAGIATALWTGSLLAQLVVVSWVAAEAVGALVEKLSLSSMDKTTATSIARSGAVVLMILAPFALSQLAADLAIEWFRTDPSSYGRIVAWAQSWQSFLEDPLVGRGFASKLVIGDLDQSATVLNYSHSVLMTYLGTTGILGIGCLIGLVAATLGALNRQHKSRLPTELQAGRYGAALLFIVLMFSSVEAGLQQMPLSWFMFLFAIGLSLRTSEPPVEEGVRLLHPAPITRQGSVNAP